MKSNSENININQKILNMRVKNIQKKWLNLPFCQSQCGKIVTSNFEERKKETN